MHFNDRFQYSINVIACSLMNVTIYFARGPVHMIEKWKNVIHYTATQYIGKVFEHLRRYLRHSRRL